MKLDKLYSLRTSFTVIGLTGRTGSGCTKIAELLSSTFNELNTEGLRKLNEFDEESTFYKKYKIAYQFVENENWDEFDVISYKHVLSFYIINKLNVYNIQKFKSLLIQLDFNDHIKIIRDIVETIRYYNYTVERIKCFNNFDNLKKNNDLELLNKIFFSQEFKELSTKISDILSKDDHYKRTELLHHVACNIRLTGDPFISEGGSVEHIYSIAILINRIIKARKHYNNKFCKPERNTKIVIDSLRNSLEIMFFKERYSAFYMIATKDVIGNSRKRIVERLKSKNIDNSSNLADRLLKLDETEYRTKDFKKGNFSSPDVANCIQKSDYHIINLKKEDLKKYLGNNETEKQFLTREEQLLKLIALIHKPGLITPSPRERSMQVAHTAKLNSGCISRSVGAVVSDQEFHIRSIGWNDVAKGHTPCNLRDMRDLFEGKDLHHYSDFEKGNSVQNTSYKYQNDERSKFKEKLEDYYGNSLNNVEDMKGKNCAFCFKSIHNHYEGEENQVHTRSLHAEENAMLQITKLGGTGVKGGYLFTTASPCELCSKKAYQLGLKKVYYIDPYPGISNAQIMKGGSVYTRPEMIAFSGAIGHSFQKFYDPFMSYKDEVNMTLEETGSNKQEIKLKRVLEKTDNQKIKDYIEKNSETNFIQLIENAIENKNK